MKLLLVLCLSFTGCALVRNYNTPSYAPMKFAHEKTRRPCSMCKGTSWYGGQNCSLCRGTGEQR